MSSFGLVKSSVELHILLNINDEDKRYKMKETDDNLYAYSINKNKSEGDIKFYFKAEDERDYLQNIHPEF